MPLNPHFTIQHLHTGKHRLKDFTQGKEIDRGLFDTHELAVEGMKRLIKPVITSYDKDGTPLN